MPEAVIRKLMHEFGFLDFGWIYAYFNISLQAAVKRVNTLSAKYYKKDMAACLLLNKFIAPVRALVDFFWNNSSKFYFDIEYAHALLEEVKEPYKSLYVLTSNTTVQAIIGQTHRYVE